MQNLAARSFAQPRRPHLLYATICVVAISLLISANQADAAPAAPVQWTYSQPDGTSFTAAKDGDEAFNWTVADDGSVIVQNADGYWYYAVVQGDRLATGARRYAIDPPPSPLVTSDDVIPLHKQHRERLAPNSRGAQGSSFSPAPSVNDSDMMTDQDLSTPHPLLVLLVQFSDVSLTSTEATWNGLIFGSTGKTVNTYYKENSNNRFYFNPAAETAGTPNDGVITVTLPYAHPNTKGSFGSLNRQLVADAIIAASAYMNYADYDIDLNGYISAEELHILTVVAGQEAAYGGDPSIPSVWAHRSWLVDPQAPLVDGVRLVNFLGDGGYTQIGEMHGDHIATIGIIAHELGHDLDLPDLYDVDPSNGNTGGVGGFSLMGSSWGALYGEELGATPVHLDAWSKMFLGFEQPIEVPYGTDVTATLSAVDTGDLSTYNIYKINTHVPRQYFLLEIRGHGEKSGYDQALVGHTHASGIAIWHIDTDIIVGYYGYVNDLIPKGVDLESFDASPNDPFYHDGYRFDGHGPVNSAVNNGTPTYLSVTDTPAAADTMTFKAGTGPYLTSAPSVASTESSISYTSQWSEDAALYYVAIPEGATAPAIEKVMQGQDAAGEAAEYAGSVSIAGGARETITITGLPPSTTYDIYIASSDTHGHRGMTIAGRITTEALRPILTVGSAVIEEADANDGSIATTLEVALANGTFESSISKADVTISSLPPGLDYTVARTSDTLLTITFTGQAAAHANEDDVHDATVTIAQAVITGANDNVTSNAFTFNFNDPPSVPALTVGSPVISEAAADDGSLASAQTVTITNGTFGAGISNADVTIDNLPAGLGFTIERTSDTLLTITFTGRATAHGNANDADNVSITVSRAVIIGASSDLTSNPFAIDFRSAAPPVVNFPVVTAPVEVGPKVEEDGRNGVSIVGLTTTSGTDASGGSAQYWNVEVSLLNEAIEGLARETGSQPIVKIPVTLSDNSKTVVRLPTSVLVEASRDVPDAILSIVADEAIYHLPVTVIDWQALADRMGADLNDLTIDVIVFPVTGDDAAKLARSASAAGLNVLGTPYEFSVTAAGDGKTEEITDYGSSYVTRFILLNQSMRGLTPSVVVYDPATDQVSFVPAVFSISGGITYAEIKRNGNSVYAVVHGRRTFADIQNHWARSDIELLASKGLLGGASASLYAPNTDITRAEFAALLTQALGLRPEPTAGGFTDVARDDSYAGYIGAAVKASLINGFNDGTFRPNDKITREQMATMIAGAIRFVGLPPATRGDPRTVLARYRDETSIGAWAKDAVARMLEAGIMTGVKPDQFQPQGFVSRAQVATIVKRLLIHLRFLN